jgi:hypothetical protein
MKIKVREKVVTFKDKKVRFIILAGVQKGLFIKKWDYACNCAIFGTPKNFAILSYLVDQFVIKNENTVLYLPKEIMQQTDFYGDIDTIVDFAVYKESLNLKRNKIKDWYHSKSSTSERIIDIDTSKIKLIENKTKELRLFYTGRVKRSMPLKVDLVGSDLICLFGSREGFSYFYNDLVYYWINRRHFNMKENNYLPHTHFGYDILQSLEERRNGRKQFAHLQGEILIELWNGNDKM